LVYLYSTIVDTYFILLCDKWISIFFRKFGLKIFKNEGYSKCQTRENVTPLPVIFNPKSSTLPISQEPFALWFLLQSLLGVLFVSFCTQLLLAFW